MSRFNTKNNKKTAGCIAMFAWIAVFVVCLVIQLVANIQFDRNYKGHLKRAGDAVSLELAERELTTAVNYLEANNLHTETGRRAGWLDDSTNILYTTPEAQISFHVDNVRSCRDEVREILANKDATPLEKSNVLMKLRESLLDNSESGHSVTCPSGLEVFPHNMGINLAFLISIIGMFVVGAWMKLTE